MTIGRNAYQLLYFGQVKESLNLAKLAVKINSSNEKLWLILSEAQTANKLFDDAIISLENAQKLNPKISEIYFSKSNIYLRQSKLEKAKVALELGLKLEPNLILHCSTIDNSSITLSILTIKKSGVRTFKKNSTDDI